MPLDSLLASLAPGGRDFERLCKWVLENVPEYRQRLKHVWLWDDWQGRWGRDAGIDLVAEDQEGGLWAVQAKHYDPAYAIKKADLDSFLSESSRPGFTYRLVIASTDHLGPTARRTLDAQEKPVGTLLRSQLEALDIAWPASVTRLRPAKPKWKRPRPHQRRAVAECARGLSVMDRGQLVMACGTGKTLVAPFLAERMAAKRVLILVPSLSLLGQTLREWATATDFDYLAVCSDDTVTKDDHDAVVATTSELGVPVTTDAVRIARFLRRRGTGTKVIFSTYQSSPQIATAQSGGVPAFDLVIADEAHRCAGPQAGVFATVLDARKIKARKRLFMTATPRYFTGRVKTEAKEADWEVASMDEEAKFGPVFHQLTFGRAIDRDLLSDYRVVVVGVTDSEAHDLATRGAFVTRDGEAITDARTLARQIGLLRTMAKLDLHRVVSFHSRIDHASRFASSLPDTNDWLPARRRVRGQLWTDHVSGKMSAGERDARLRRLAAVKGDARGVLTNARCLTEGVDVPTLDGVAFIDPRRSQVDVVQAVGRAIRRAEGKQLGTIVVPVLVEAGGGDPEVALQSSEFDRVWQVVKALRAHDEVLADELDELRRDRGRRGTSARRPRKIVMDMPVGIGVAFARAFDAQVVERSTSRWDEGLGATRAYSEQHGHIRVPSGFVTAHGFLLGRWISNRRIERNRGALSAERVSALDALGMTWDPHDDGWLRGLAAARAYREFHGDLRPPQKFRAADGFALGSWILTRRYERRRGRLSDERIAALDALDMVWDRLDDNWRRGLAEARRYHQAHGHLRVPAQLVTSDGFRLGSWVSTRRAKRAQGKLSADRIADLDALDMVWHPRDDDWQRGIAVARAYWKANGHLRVHPKAVTDGGFLLGSWIGSRRSERKRGVLAVERVAALDAIGMVWDPPEQGWQRGIAAARSYRAAHGHLRVPRTFVADDGFKLGSWITVRRHQRSRGKLAPDRIAQLDALGMVWRPFEADWERGIAAARTFRASEGHLRVPGKFVTEDGFRLGGWIVTRRQERTLLTTERTAELDALDMVWDLRADDWQRGIAAARAFQGDNGHLLVPRGFVTDGGFRLGEWLHNRRQEHRRGKVSPERVADLDALGIEWDPGQSWRRNR